MKRCDSDGKEPASYVGDPGLILGPGRCPREGNVNTHQCSCLGNPTDRGAWRAAVHASQSRADTHT